MAMTKKEREAVRLLKRKLSVLAALRWTEEVNPDLAPPEWNKPDVKGWIPCYDRVEKAITNSAFHHIGDWEGKSWAQNTRSLYSTELLALKALRHEMELRFAEKLASVDLQIAAAKGEESEA